MSLTCGNVYNLKILRKTDIGYMLTNGTDEVFLHFNDSLEKNLSVDDSVDAFLYYDQKGRITATLETPAMTIDRPAKLAVKSINHQLGVFLNMGITKDILLSKDDLPLNHDEWPQVDDEIYVKMIHKNRLTAKPIHKEDLSVDKEYEMNKKQHATIQRIGHSGLNLLTDDGVWVYVHKSMVKDQVWVGKKVEVLITHKSDKGYIGSLLKLKENQMVDDADIILQYLIKNKTLPLDSQSTPDDILKFFDMSKKAFKRAIGILYKQRRIVFEEGMTKIVEV